MASLNSLRTKGGVIVSVVIGVALLSFLLGDMMSSGGALNSNKMEVGSINGTDVDYFEFNSKADRFTVVAQMMSGRESLSAEQQDATRDMAWESYVTEYSYNPGFEALGITVFENEQLDMVNGEYTSPVLTNIFSNSGAYDPAFVAQFLANMDNDPSGRTAIVWDYIKAQMNDERAMSKYMALVKKGMYVSDFEVEQTLKYSKDVAEAKYIVKEYSSVPDSTITISDSEIKKYYDENKESFKQAASRDIEYVVFDLLPSPQDYKDAEIHINKIAEEFKASADPMQYASLNSQQTPDKRYYKADQLSADVESKLYNNPDSIYGPVLKNDTYTISRLVEMKSLPDTLGAKHILLAATATKTADSLVTALASGADFAEASSKHSMDQTAASNGGDLGKFAYEYMIPEFSEACSAHKVGDIFTVNTQFGIHVVELTYKTANVDKAQIATITYDVDPSAATQQVVYGNASEFAGAAAGSYANFSSAATASALSKRIARINNTDKNINGLNESRELVRWAYNGKKGDVSQIMEIDGDYVVASLIATSDFGPSELNSVSSVIRNKLMEKKKGEAIAKTMTGSSIDAIAKSLDLKVEETKDVQFSSFYVNGLGVEPKLIGAMLSAPENKVSKPINGLAGVYVLDVTARTPIEPAITKEQEMVRMQSTAQGYLDQRLVQTLVSLSNVQDLRAKFF